MVKLPVDIPVPTILRAKSQGISIHRDSLDSWAIRIFPMDRKVSDSSADCCLFSKIDELPAFLKRTRNTLFLSGRGIVAIKGIPGEAAHSASSFPEAEFIIHDGISGTMLISRPYLDQVLSQLNRRKIWINRIAVSPGQSAKEWSDPISLDGLSFLEHPLSEAQRRESEWWRRRRLLRVSAPIMMIVLAACSLWMRVQSETISEEIRQQAGKLSLRLEQAGEEERRSDILYDHGFLLSERMADLFRLIPESCRLTEITAFPITEERGSTGPSINDSSWVMLIGAEQGSALSEMIRLTEELEWIRECGIQRVSSSAGKPLGMKLELKIRRPGE